MDSAARKTIAASMIGNVIEWYEFAIYGNFAAAIGRDFFPRQDAVAQLIAETVSCCDRPPAPATADEARQHASSDGPAASGLLLCSYPATGKV
jgi:hypothetical protein